MKHSDFHIGMAFTTSDGEFHWRCTDVGTRTIVAIRTNCPTQPGPFNGPPYAVSEIVFDEYDFEGCASHALDGSPK